MFSRAAKRGLKTSGVKVSLLLPIVASALLLSLIGAPPFPSDDANRPLIRRKLHPLGNGRFRVTLTIEQLPSTTALILNDTFPPGSDGSDGPVAVHGIKEGNAMVRKDRASIRWVLMAPKPGQSVEYQVRSESADFEGTWILPNEVSGEIL